MRRFFRTLGRRESVLEERLRTGVAALVSSVEAGRALDRAELEELEGLRQLLELRGSVVRRREEWVATVAAALVVALVVSGLLLLRRVGTVEVFGRVHASAVQLSMDGRMILALDRPLEEVRARGYTHVEGLPVDPSQGMPASFAAKRLPGGTLTLQQLALPEAVRIRFERVEPGTMGLKVDQGRPGGRVRIEAQGPAHFITRSETLRVAEGAQQGASMDFGTETFNMSFVPADSAGDLLTGVGADSLSFTELRHTADGARSEVALLSTIDRGELTLPGLRGETVMLNPGERLHMVTPSLRVYRIRQNSGGLSVEFRAHASELALGEGATRRDLRPSLLEWYAANRRFELALTVYVSGLTMVLGILAWWRRNR